MFHPIQQEEFDLRISKLQEILKTRDIDAYLVHGTSSNYENVRYLSNHWPMFEVSGVIVPKEGSAVLLIGAEAPGLALESALGKNYKIMDEYGNSFGLKWNGVNYCDFRTLFDEISNGKGIKRVALGDYRITPHFIVENIKKTLGINGEIIIAPEIMDNLRKDKTENEIQIIKQANKINEKVFDDFLGQVTPEMTELECQGLILSGIYKYGGEAESFPTLLYAGKRTLNMIGRGTHAVIGNQLVGADFGAMLGGYASAFSRPFMFGKMPDKMKKEINFMVDVHEKIMMEWVKPGVVMDDVYRKYAKEFEDNGYGRPPANASHGIGIFECENPGLRPGVMDEVKEGMVFACDNFFKSKDYGFRIEDCYVVRIGGNEIFTNEYWYPIEL